MATKRTSEDAARVKQMFSELCDAATMGKAGSGNASRMLALYAAAQAACIEAIADLDNHRPDTKEISRASRKAQSRWTRFCQMHNRFVILPISIANAEKRAKAKTNAAWAKVRAAEDAACMAALEERGIGHRIMPPLG